MPQTYFTADWHFSHPNIARYCPQFRLQTTPSKDKYARWTKKNGLYKIGYKQHTRTDEEGYIEKLHITPANTHECNHLPPLLEGIVLI